MAVEQLCEQPHARREQSGMNVDLVAIKAGVIGYRLNADDVIPTAHEEVAFPRLNLARLWIDSLKKNGSRSGG